MANVEAAINVVVRGTSAVNQLLQNVGQLESIVDRINSTPLSIAQNRVQRDLNNNMNALRGYQDRLADLGKQEDALSRGRDAAARRFADVQRRQREQLDQVRQLEEQIARRRLRPENNSPTYQRLSAGIREAQEAFQGMAGESSRAERNLQSLEQELNSLSAAMQQTAQKGRTAVGSIIQAEEALRPTRAIGRLADELLRYGDSLRMTRNEAATYRRLPNQVATYRELQQEIEQTRESAQSLRAELRQLGAAEDVVPVRAGTGAFAARQRNEEIQARNRRRQEIEGQIGQQDAEVARLERRLDELGPRIIANQERLRTAQRTNPTGLATSLNQLQAQAEALALVANNSAIASSQFNQFAVAAEATAIKLSRAQQRSFAALAAGFSAQGPAGLAGLGANQVAGSRSLVAQAIADIPLLTRSEAALSQHISLLTQLKSIVPLLSNEYTVLGDNIDRLTNELQEAQRLGVERAAAGGMTGGTVAQQELRRAQGPISLLPQFSIESEAKRLQFNQKVEESLNQQDKLLTDISTSSLSIAEKSRLRLRLDEAIDALADTTSKTRLRDSERITKSVKDELTNLQKVERYRDRLIGKAEKLINTEKNKEQAIEGLRDRLAEARGRVEESAKANLIDQVQKRRILANIDSASLAIDEKRLKVATALTGDIDKQRIAAERITKATKNQVSGVLGTSFSPLLGNLPSGAIPGSPAFKKEFDKQIADLWKRSGGPALPPGFEAKNIRSGQLSPIGGNVAVENALKSAEIIQARLLDLQKRGIPVNQELLDIQNAVSFAKADDFQNTSKSLQQLVTANSLGGKRVQLENYVLKSKRAEIDAQSNIVKYWTQLNTLANNYTIQQGKGVSFLDEQANLQKLITDNTLQSVQSNSANEQILKNALSYYRDILDLRITEAKVAGQYAGGPSASALNAPEKIERARAQLLKKALGDQASLIKLEASGADIANERLQVEAAILRLKELQGKATRDEVEMLAQQLLDISNLTKEVANAMPRKGKGAGGFEAALPAQEVRKQYNKIVSDLNAVTSGADSAGENVVSTFVKNLLDGSSKSMAAGAAFAKAGVKGILKALGIASPSKVITEIVSILISTWESKLASGTGRIKSAFQEAFAMGQLATGAPDKTPAFMSGTGQMSDLAERVGAFVARSTAKPSFYRKLLPVIGENIISSPAVTEAIYRQQYEKGAITPATLLPVEGRRALRGTPRIPGGNLESALLASAFQSASRTGAFVGPLASALVRTAEIPGQAGIGIGGMGVPSTSVAASSGIFSSLTKQAQLATEGVYSMVAQNTFEDFSKRASKITAGSTPTALDSLKQSLSILGSDLSSKGQALKSSGATSVKKVGEFVDDITSLGKTLSTSREVTQAASNLKGAARNLFDGVSSKVSSLLDSDLLQVERQVSLAQASKGGRVFGKHFWAGEEKTYKSPGYMEGMLGIPDDLQDISRESGGKLRRAIERFYGRIIDTLEGYSSGGPGGRGPGGRGLAGPAGGPNDPSNPVNQTAQAMQKLSNISKLTNNNLEKLEQRFTELRNKADATGAEFRQLTDGLARINREQARRDPNADFLTRRFGPRAAQGISEGLIGGAFPILFGQGMGASLGGLVGGGAGGFIGGNLGFGLSLLGTAFGSVFDQLNQAAQETGKSLNRPIENFEKLKEAGLFASKEQEYYISKLIESGRTTEATAQIQAEMIRKIGVGGVNDLMRLGDASSDLSKAWAEFNLELQAALAGPMAGLLEWITKVVRLSTGSAQRQALELDPEAFRRAQTEANRLERAGKSPLSPQDRGKYETELNRLSNQIIEKSVSRLRPTKSDPSRVEADLRKQVENAEKIRSLNQQGIDLQRSADELRRNNEDTVYGLRKRAADMEREAADFRRSIEDEIFGKRQELEKMLIENDRKRKQNAIDTVDLQLQELASGLDPVSAKVVDAGREYLKIVGEAFADKEQRERNLALDLVQMQRESDRFKLQVEDRVRQMNEQRDEFTRDVARTKTQMEFAALDYAKQVEDYRLQMAQRRFELAIQEGNVTKAAAIAAQEGLAVPATGKNYANIGGFQSGRQMLHGIPGYAGFDPSHASETNIHYHFAGKNPAETKAVADYLKGLGYQITEFGQYGQGVGRHARGSQHYREQGFNAFDIPGSSMGGPISQIIEGQKRVHALIGDFLGLSTGARAAIVGTAGTAGKVGMPVAPTPPPLPGLPMAPGAVGVGDLMQDYESFIQKITKARKEGNKAEEEALQIRIKQAQAALVEKALQPVKAIQEQTQSMYDEIEARKLRNRLLAEGVRPEIAEGEVRVLEITRQFSKLIEGQDELLRKANKGKFDSATAAYDAALARITEISATQKLTPELEKERIELEGILRARKAIKDAQPGTVQGARDAAVASVMGPRETIQEEIGQVEQALAKLTDPANMAISAAERIGSAFGDSFKGIINGSMTAQEALAGFFQSVADHFLDMASQIIAKWIQMTILNSILKLFPGSGIASAISPEAAAIGQGASILTAANGAFFDKRIEAFAMGGVFNSPSIERFANGGMFTNSIVSSPTLFKFADGGAMSTGLMGEAGPEAIMPLRRGPGGRLGVDASGSSGDVNIVVNVDASGSAVQGDEPNAAQLGRVISVAVQSEIMKQQRPGGLLSGTRR